MRTRDKEQSMASIDTQDLLASLQSALGGKGATAGAQTEGGTGNSEEPDAATNRTTETEEPARRSKTVCDIAKT